MTIDISDNDPRISYTANANGAQTVFAVPFEFFDNSDLKVYVAGVLKSEGTGSANYGVSGGAGSTGTVTFVSGVTASATVVITRSITIERVTDFTAGADINRAALNTQLDTLTAIAADLKDTAGRALQLTDFDAAASLVLPAVDDRKGKVLAFNETSGAVEAGPSTSAVQSVADNAAAVNLIGTADAISDINDLATSTNISNISSVAGIASNISTVAGIASDVTSVAGDATDIGAVAGKATEIGRLGTADAVADLALLGTSTVVADIATVAGVASTMSAAASNASAAAASATAAANSAAAAATALDSFDDRYLGSKSSEPSVDNDGNALVSGALYFNSTSNGMKVYDGGSWINASSAGAVSLLDYEYTATAGQTTFSGSDNNSATLAYAVGNLIVSLNGIILDNGSDYTATSGTSIVLASGAALNDHLAVIAFKSFTVADAVAASTGGTFAGNVAVTGNISVTGTVDGRDVAADGTKLDTNIPSSLGTAGQILTVNPAGNAGAWVEASGGGEQEFTATGAITAGQPVGVNSDGTISTAIAIKSSVNKPAYTGSTLTFQGISYDAAQDKFLMLAHRANENLAIVGGVSGETFSFGTATTINNSNIPQNRQRVVYDSASGKHLIIYEQQSNQQIRARVATVSGTSVSFGTDVVTEAGTGGDKYISASSAGANKVIMIARQEAAYAGNYYVWARIFTISGTSVSFGSLVDVSGATASTGTGHRYGVCYDSNADRVVVFYVISGDTTLYAKVGTVSGSSVSFGSAVDTGYDCQSGDLRPVFDPSTNKVVLVFSDSGNSSITKAIVGTVSGTSISFASDPTTFGANIGNPTAVYNSTNSTIVLGYSNSLEVIKVSGTKVHRDRVFDTSTVGTIPQTVYDDNNQSVVATDTQGECISIKTISPKFAGFAKENISNGATGKVTVTGGINTSQSGLITGFDYGLPSDSATLISGSTNKVGVALSVTSILVTEGSI